MTSVNPLDSSVPSDGTRVFKAAFFRSYRVHWTLRDRVRPADLVLGLRGPVDAQSGMVLNLVEVDRVAPVLIEAFEADVHANRTSALRSLARLWSRALGEWGLEFVRVELRESRRRSEWGQDGRPSFRVRRVWGPQGEWPVGFLEAVYRNEADAARVRRFLRQTNELSSQDILHRLRLESGISEVSFQEWKSRRTHRWGLSGRADIASEELLAQNRSGRSR